ncbi:MAG: P83/100 family protein [Treponema sp.]|nr:P83/100 family protein [Treponema sp.]
MKKITCLLLISLLSISSIFSLEVDKNELNTTGNEIIEFINYTGPHKVIDSAQAIKEIGSDLGKDISLSVSSTNGSNEKYYVVHSVTSESKDQLDADIIYIGSTATVDHVDNLRRIISGYLQSAYNYSEKDANTLAVFITVYNAVYRGKLDTFKSKYTEDVVKNLSSENCGLSTNYKDWPGKSEIVIPLFDVKNGGLSTVDTSVIADSKVVDSMQEDEDRNIDSRKDMVDLKEREADESSEKAQEAQKEAVQEQKVLNETKKEAEEAKKEAEEAKKEAEEAKKVAEENPNDKKAQETAKEAEKKAEEATAKAEEKQQQVEEQQKKTDDAKEAAKEAQEIADKKQNEAQTERKEIAQDQQEIQQEKIAEAKANTEYGIIIVDEENLLSRLVKFNSDNGEIIRKSPVAVIRNRTIFEVGSEGSEQFISVAGDNAGNGTIKLVLMDQDNMEITRESNETLSEDSVLVKDGDDYYCVIDDNGKWVVAKYNAELSLRYKSSIAVKSSTPITITKSGVVVTDSTGQLMLLSKTDLSAITKKSSGKYSDAK